MRHTHTQTQVEVLIRIAESADELDVDGDEFLTVVCVSFL